MWEKGLQRIDVSREDVKTGSKNVWCRMTNPVSEEESDRLLNPMYKEPELLTSGAVAAISILIIDPWSGLGWTWSCGSEDDIKKKFCTDSGTESPVVVKSSDLTEEDRSPAVHRPLNGKPN